MSLQPPFSLPQTTWQSMRSWLVVTYGHRLISCIQTAVCLSVCHCFCCPLAISSHCDEHSNCSPFVFIGLSFSSGRVARLTWRLADGSSAPSPRQPSAYDNRTPRHPSPAAPWPPPCTRHGSMCPQPAWACTIRRRVRATHLRGLPLRQSLR